MLCDNTQLEGRQFRIEGMWYRYNFVFATSGHFQAIRQELTAINAPLKRVRKAIASSSRGIPDGCSSTELIIAFVTCKMKRIRN